MKVSINKYERNVELGKLLYVARLASNDSDSYELIKSIIRNEITDNKGVNQLAEGFKRAYKKWEEKELKDLSYLTEILVSCGLGHTISNNLTDSIAILLEKYGYKDVSFSKVLPSGEFIFEEREYIIITAICSSSVAIYDYNKLLNNIIPYEKLSKDDCEHVRNFQTYFTHEELLEGEIELENNRRKRLEDEEDDWEDED